MQRFNEAPPPLSFAERSPSPSLRDGEDVKVESKPHWAHQIAQLAAPIRPSSITSA
jgi:hypothetical protein